MFDFKYEYIIVPGDYTCDTCMLSINIGTDKSEIKLMAFSDCDLCVGSSEMVGDTLKLFLNSVPDKVDTSYVYNTETKKNEPVIVSYYFVDPGPGTCLSTYQYSFLGLNEMPKAILCNNKIIMECAFKNETFEIYNNDTMNYTDKYGLKQGDWIEFYPNGKINRKYYYINGRVKEGYEKNMNGDTISIFAPFEY